MHLHVCVSDYRFTTLLFFFPLKMRTAAALFIFTMCFTVPLTGGEGPRVCSKCIFYVVIECICIRGLVLKRGSVEKESTPRESRGQLRDLPSAVMCKSRRAVVKHSHTHTHVYKLFMFTVQHVQIKGTFCWMAYQTYIFCFPLIPLSPSCKPWQQHITCQHALQCT